MTVPKSSLRRVRTAHHWPTRWRAGTPALRDFLCFTGGPTAHARLLRRVFGFRFSVEHQCRGAPYVFRASYAPRTARETRPTHFSNPISGCMSPRAWFGKSLAVAGGKNAVVEGKGENTEDHPVPTPGENYADQKVIAGREKRWWPI